MLDYLVDSSVISPSLEHDVLFERFRAFVESGEARVLIPHEALEELYSGPSLEKYRDKIASKLARLGQLLRDNDSSRLHLALSASALFEREINRPISRIPTVSADRRRALANQLSNPSWVRNVLLVGDNPEKVWREKLYFTEKSFGLPAFMAERLGWSSNPGTELLALIRGFKSLSPNDMIIEKVAEQSRGTFSAADILAHPERFPATICFASAMYFQHVASSIAHPLVASAADTDLVAALRCRAKDTGRHYDNYVASSAVYCTSLVTADNQMVRRAQFMKEKGLVAYDVVHWSMSLT